jgi:hypothetical protein
LVGYAEFNQFVRLDDFALRHEPLIRREMDDAPGYPFNRFGDGVRLAAGLYLRRATTSLRDVLMREVAGAREGHAAPAARPRRRTTRVSFARYEPVSEEVSLPAGRLIEYDPTTRERGCRGHARTQNALASFLENRGLQPLKSAATGPDFDLAWERDGRLIVAEVKSLTIENETTQIRLGLGQVLQYRHQLRLGRPDVSAILAIERAPTDLDWVAVCSDLGVTLIWPPDFVGLE